MAFPISLVSNLLSLSSEPPLDIRRKVSTVNYFLAFFRKRNYPNIPLLKSADSYQALFSGIVENLGPLDLNIDILSISPSATSKQVI